MQCHCCGRKEATHGYCQECYCNDTSFDEEEFVRLKQRLADVEELNAKYWRQLYGHDASEMEIVKMENKKLKAQLAKKDEKTDNSQDNGIESPYHPSRMCPGN